MDVPNEYITQEGTSSIELTLCGNPRPKLFYTFQGKTKESKIVQSLNDTKKMYKYEIVLENVDRKSYGSTIEFNATCFKD